MLSLLRLSSRPFRLFSKGKFYHPTAYNFDIDHHQSESDKLQYYINMYRKYGHHYASLDPLKIHHNTEQFVKPVDLQIKNQDSLSSLDPRQSYISGQCQNVKQLEQKLNQVYKSACGVEFQHVANAQQQTWLYNKFEQAMLCQVSQDKKREMAQLLIQTEALDHFLHKKFVTFKRYSGEGAQSAVVALKTLFQYAAQRDVENIVMGIPHRGRLNVLVNLLDYPAADLFRKISGKTDTPSDLVSAIDDVTSHIAQSVQKTYKTAAGQKKTYISTLHNPSHLEAQNAVSMGKTRSKQQYTKKDVLNVQVHGDAAFSAQGIVFQSLCLSRVPYYSIGGTVHMIVNNQIGYTTKPIHARPSKYCSDVVKGFGIPIVHVNAESVQDVYRVMRFALDYRMQFKKDILVDLICYRRYGHNEVDEPQFTQPRMYNQIRKHQTTYPKSYFESVKKSGLLEQNTYDDIRKKAFEGWESDFNASKTVEKILLKDYSSADRKGQKTNTSSWKDFKPSILGTEQNTNVDQALLRQFAKASTFYPPGFSIHQRIQRFHVEDRLKSIEKNQLNWATCEALALFSLVAEGYNVRMTGQDVERGTFSQRHINLTDQKTEAQFNALQFFSEQAPGRGNVEICNSPLSQNGVMSYQYGYSIDNPNNMAIWQAQFGDFFNPAQVVIDTYITNGEAKWLRQSGLVLLLPHGYDGAGPEHSSCRIQRFLLLANTDGINRQYKYKEHDPNRRPLKIGEEVFYQNIQEANFSFAYPTTPANYFHLLRRQMKRNFRKPLVVAGPKTLLRHPKCLSKFSDMSSVTNFKRILHYTPQQALGKSRNLIICSGKYVYDIINLLENSKISDTSVVTIEQLFPFPEQELKQVIQQVPQDATVLWVQQENMNSGAYVFAQPHISRILLECGKKGLKYVGRRALAMTAVGSSELHSREAKELSEYLASLIK